MDATMLSNVTVIWSAAAGSALLLGIVHALVWASDRRSRAHLAFAIASIGLAVESIIELQMLHAQTAQQWGELVWWSHFPLFLIVCGMAVFLRSYLNAGRLWLLVAVVAMRSAIMVLNCFSEPNFNFQRIDAVGTIPWLGDEVTIVTSAVTGRHQWLALVASLLLPLFILDVVITLWRRGSAEGRRLALVVGGPVLMSVFISFVLTQLVIWRVVQMPLVVIPPFFIALVAMALELGRNVVRAASLARDLTESERRLELAASAAGAGFWAWNTASARIWATERARAIMGLDRSAELCPNDVLKFVDEGDLLELRSAFCSALEHGGEHVLQFRIAAPESDVRWVVAHGTVELDPRGNSAMLRGVVRDVTTRRRAEEERAELYRKLAHAGRVTTLGQLAAALAHEISQPLSAIQQNSEAARLLLARQTIDTDELREIVEDIVRDNHRATQVVHRLRAWLKQGHMRRETICLESLAREVLALVRSEAVAKKITIECALPAVLPAVRGDPVHLSQVLLNLIMNAMEAVKSVNSGRPRVSISATIVPEKACCTVCVKDTGPGIAPDQLNCIFEPFFTSKSEGLGIGLSISRAIIEAHGGRLWAENQPRGGASFCFTVPVMDSNLSLSA